MLLSYRPRFVSSISFRLTFASTLVLHRLVAYVIAPYSGPVMLITCPKCNSHDVYPSRSKAPLERMLRVMSLPTYHCAKCGAQFRYRTSPEELRMLNRELLLRTAIRSLGSQASM